MNAPLKYIGPYRILRSIGEGGVGEVFAAVHEQLGRRVAIKMLLPKYAQDPEIIARFVQEARALAQFENHPGVVRVHEFDKPDGGMPYLAMELLEGKTLRAWIRDHDGPVPLEAALALCHHVADIMVDIHAKGFVHRDLKPENIMLVPDNHSGIRVRPKVLDFGVVKVPPQAADVDNVGTLVKTAGHHLLGTTMYMAPEQCKSPTNVSHPADVYALGVVLYELLAGKPPFVSDDPVELVMMHMRDVPAPLNECVPAVPPALGAFVASMLCKVPDERPSMRHCRDMLARGFPPDAVECPFPGLLPFIEAQTALFFGRTTETRDLLAMMCEVHEGKTRRWLQIEGASGVGKSSLVQAALVPSLKNSNQWRIVTLRPSEDPVRSLAVALSLAYGTNPEETEASFRASHGALDKFVLDHHLEDVRLLVVIEQFEELFALGGAHVSVFDRLLSTILENSASPLRLLATIRNDFLHCFDLAPGLARLLNTEALRYHVRPMGESALAEVITGMAERVGLRLSEGLADRMVRDAAGTDVRLPLLGHALQSLWSSRRGGALTHEHYEVMGGVGGALSTHVVALVDELGEAGRERAKWVVLDLVQIGRGAPDTRRQRTREEVTKAAGGDKLGHDVLVRLSGVVPDGFATSPIRLVVFSGNASDPREQRVDLVHEMVLQTVPMVAGWIREERELLEHLVMLEGAASAWVGAKKPGGLPSGPLLEYYLHGANNSAAQRVRLERMASPDARAFLHEALRLDRRRTWVWRGMGVLMALAVAAIIVVAIEARAGQERARTNLEALLKTTDEIVNDIDWPTGRIAHTEQLRRDILVPLHNRLDSLDEQENDALRNGKISIKHRLSDFKRTYGTLEESTAFVDTAFALIKEGLDHDPSNGKLRDEHAMNLSKRGKLFLFEGKPQEALTDFESALSTFEEGVEMQPLATQYIEKGEALMALGRPDLAVESYDKGIFKWNELAGPPTADYERAMLAEALVLRAKATKNSAKAMTQLDRAYPLAFVLAQAESHNLLYQSILARVLVARGSLFRTEERFDDARTAYEQARTLAETMREGDENHKEYALLMCEALWGLENVRGAPPAQVKAWQTQRCKIAKEFVDKDSLDLRFQPYWCL